jgi:hypothetical protein
MKKIGIIQSRGLGDICLALPIAHYYHQRDYEIHWPICEEFYPSFKDTAPWVKWISIPTDARGEFFYNEPTRRLQSAKCEEIICLYQSLNVVPELSQVPWFQIQKFDEFKYTKAGVPFLYKWRLNDCINRNHKKEQALFDRLVKQENYFVTHTKGSSFSVTPDLTAIPSDWQHIEITEGITDNVFDWLGIIEGAQAVILLDSIFSNIVDQLDIKVDKYWIPRSHIHLTPVLGSEWTILDPPEKSLASQKIFGAAPC